MEAYALQWLTLVSGKSLYAGISGDDRYWTETELRLFQDKASFDKFDQYAGNTSTVFQTWLQHPDFDSFWKPIYLSPESIAKIQLPVLEITGYRDDDEPASLSFYRDHLRSSDPETLNRFFFIVGPWNHVGTREPKPVVWNEEFGPASLVDMRLLQKQWFDWTLKSGTKPAFLKDHVLYYVQGYGAECWKHASTLDAAAKTSRVLYLEPGAGAKSVFQSGSLAGQSSDSSPTIFVSDPNDLRSAETSRVAYGKIVLHEDEPGFDLHGNGLVYQTSPFPAAAEMDGVAELHLWLQIDAPDTDLAYSLYLVTPNGKTHWLSTSRVRARYRRGLEHGEPITQGQPEEYTFPSGWWVAQRIPKGSYLRVIVEAVNQPEMQKNWNSMKPVSEQAGADAKVARIQLFQESQHRSRLVLPMGDPSAPCTMTNLLSEP
jgi:hypothetical protein